jgi:hypothetical protein
MKRTCIATVLLLLSTASMAETAVPLCVLAPDAMPQSWRPSGAAQQALSSAEPWSASEAEDVAFAIRTGLDEMLDHFTQRGPDAVTAMWEDAVGALIEVTYSSANPPAIDDAARDGARRNLATLMEPFLQRDPAAAACSEFEDLLPLAMYANKFYSGEDVRTAAMVALANSAYRDCPSLDAAMGGDYRKLLADPDAATEDVFDLMIWSLLFIDAELIPGLDLPAEAREFSPALWRYFDTYHLAGASEFEDGAWDPEFIEIAYLATHIAYIPTGNHRFAIYIEDLPSLYLYHRENFYPVLEMGELDLVAEFVDSLRQYGCTEENDLQVRDGTRFLLELFHGGGDRWMAYREPDETDADVDDYDLVHKAWTAVLGVRPRVLEQPEPGTYGGVVRAWLPQPR